MKKIILTIFFAFIFVPSVSALSKEDIKFPIAELGGCKSEAQCKSFCEKLDNRKGVCFEFAKKYNLVSSEEISKVEKFKKITKENGGPDFCKVSNGCDIAQFCEDSKHITECLGFAQSNNLISDKELEEARKVEKALGSTDKTPGGCNGKEACMQFCADTKHSSECLNFAKKLGVITEKEAAETEKFVSLIKSGQAPGGAKSKEECLAYCKQPGRLEECVNFATKVGFLTKEDAEIVRKTGGKGPGGCSSKGECESFCNNPSNKDVCMEFAKAQGLDIGITSGPGGCSDTASCTAYCKEHYQDEQCQKLMNQYGGGFSGPGGCKDIASCTDYCKSNLSDPECAKYAGQASGQTDSFKGPGGCNSMDSCISYCKANQSDPECQKYASQYGGSSKEERQQIPQSDQQQPQPPQ